MVVLNTQSEFGYAPPPQTPYSIITNIPGWDMLHGVREGDASPLANVVNIYPRFSPMQFAAQFSVELGKRVGCEGKKVMPYLNPIMWEYTARGVASKYRKDNAISPENLTFKCVDVGGHRVYAVLYDPKYSKALFHTWGTPGLGLSIRGGELLLKSIDSLQEVKFEPGQVPKPTWTPEGPSHQALKDRIIELVHRAAIDPEKVTSKADDVFLYPTGMAAVYHTTNLLLERRPGTAVVLGTVFHSTYHHLQEENEHRWKHVGLVDKAAIDGFERWLEEEEKEDRPVSFVIIEAPGNPTLDMADLPRLKALSEKYGFVFIVDDTVGGFANIDVIAHSDIILTSLTKSFSGKADVMGGSIVLNALSPYYQDLSAQFSAKYHNELFAADAQVLLENSQEFLQRTPILNQNAEAMAKFLHQHANDPNSPVASVQYPSVLPSKGHYDAFKRRSTPELPEPGYGCLLTVNFESVATAKAFYDRLGFYPSPHLGGHVSIQFAYNMFLFGKDQVEREYFKKIGVREESVRISAGLEDEGDLIDTLRDALDAAAEVKKKGA